MDLTIKNYSTTATITIDDEAGIYDAVDMIAKLLNISGYHYKSIADAFKDESEKIYERFNF